jgi:TPR repeat protein
MYEHGNGVQQSYAEAVTLYLTAAEQGNAIAQFDVGVMYEHGRGVIQNYAEAERWFRKAADQGYANAQTALDHFSNADGNPGGPLEGYSR